MAMLDRLELPRKNILAFMLRALAQEMRSFSILLVVHHRRACSIDLAQIGHKFLAHAARDDAQGEKSGS